MVLLKNLSWNDRHAGLHRMVGEKDKRYVGFGAEALFFLLLHAFWQLNMHRVYGRVIEYTKESEALIKEVSFEKEAICKRFI